jgi:outer membrane cobalamin receptor
MVDGDILPFVYAAGTKIKTCDGIFLKSSGAKLYNLPDLNDLYWDSTGMAAGNPNLGPEYGWNIEGGILQEHERNNFNFQHEITIYQNKLFDAIIWSQNEKGIWIPDNYDRSLIRGLEFSGKYTLKFINSSFVAAYDYAYTNAVVFKERDGTYIGKPKRYVPKHKTGVRLQVQIKKFSSGIYAQIVDERPIDRAENYLDPFVLVDLNARYRFHIYRSHLSVYFKLKNILNTNYKLRAGYAQPLRGIYFGIIYKL